MDFKTGIMTALLAVSLSVSQALAKPNLTPEQLAKAKETASQMKPPVDLDALFQEADRLGVECEGDLTRRAIIKMCKLDVEGAQSEERIKASKERQAKLREENRIIEERLRKKVDDLADKADKKLKQK